ncbi:MAG TPA: PA14 domain-containing protein [Byssovorax sp.]|jgi:hypothetical protein
MDARFVSLGTLAAALLVASTGSADAPKAAPARAKVAAASSARVAHVAASTVFGGARPSKPSLEGLIYLVPEGTSRLPDFAALTPVGQLFTTTLDVTPRRFEAGFPGVSNRFEWFAIDYRGTFRVAEAGPYWFRLTADDGARLLVDGELVIDDDGVHPPKTVERARNLTGGEHRVEVQYFQGPRFEIALVLEVSLGDEPYHLFRSDTPLGAAPPPSTHAR